MEMLMQYMWEHRLWGARELATNDGRRVRVIDPGRRNTDAGPDFFNAKVEIDGCLWAGNVEIHYRASDWHRHGHDDDPAYDTVVLHVVAKDDAPVVRANGERIPQMVMECTAEIADRYAALVNSTVELPCRQMIREMTSLDVAEWVQSLIFERLADKSRRVKGLLDRFHGSWEDTCYVTLARTIGFGTNSDAFELLAKSLPLNLLHKHADSLLQLEALFSGRQDCSTVQPPTAIKSNCSANMRFSAPNSHCAALKDLCGRHSVCVRRTSRGAASPCLPILCTTASA